MRYVTRSPFEIGHRVWQLRPPTPSLTVVVKGTFDPAAGSPAPFAEEPILVTGEAHHDDDVEQSLRAPSDFPLLKPKGECFVVGSAWAPGGRPATAVACRFKIGPIRKEFGVFGDRHWERGLVARPSDPAPFTSMPLRMERAFGGPDYGDNPYGRGMETVEIDGTAVRPLPNLEQTNDPVSSTSHRPDPVVVGPLPMTWPSRAAYAGTYDQAYLTERWPWLPKDFDWHFFLAAPPDQQLKEGFFRGDEVLEVDGLHPSQPSLRSRLPSVRPRVFLDTLNRGATKFEEVPMKLDTVVWDGDAGKLTCTWRGLVEVASESLDEIQHVFVDHEPLSGPTGTAESFKAHFEQQLREEEEEEEEAEGEEPPALDDPASSEPDEDDEPDDAAATDPSAEEEARSAETDAQERELEAKMAELEAKMAELGISTEAEAPEVEASSPPDMRAMLDRLAESGTEVPAELVAMVEELEQEPEPEPQVESPPEPPDAPPVLEGRELVEARIAAGEALTELDLTGADLHAMDLSGQDFTGSILRQVSLAQSNLSRAVLVGVVLAESDLAEADFSEANLEGADLAGANLQKARLGIAHLADADLSEARLVDADLTRAVAPRALFVDANLEAANLTRGDFLEADFERANLRRVNAVEARFVDATLENAVADDAVFDRAGMERVRGEGLSAERARFGTLNAPDSFWERAVLNQADFSFSQMSRADFSDASLVGAEMDGCVLTQARFERANAHSLRGRKADFMEASFESADLTHADLRGANLFGAELWRAQTNHAQLALANLTRTKLES